MMSVRNTLRNAVRVLMRVLVLVCMAACCASEALIIRAHGMTCAARRMHHGITEKEGIECIM